MKTTSKTYRGIWTILTLVFTKTLIRFFLELFSNPDSSGIIGSWYVLLQYFVFFLAMTLGLGIIFGTICRESLQKWIAVVAKSLPIIFIAPILDLIISKGHGICMAYSGSSGIGMLRDFATFFGKFTHCGISIGMRIEIIIILLIIGWTIWKKTHALRKAILGIFLGYSLLFVNAVIPGLLGIHAISTLSLREFVLVVSCIHFLTSVIFIIIIWFSEKKSDFLVWVHNTRWERVIYYILIATLGMIAAHTLNAIPFNWLTGIKSFVAIVAFIANCWAGAVWNDINDQDIDIVSSPDRPLSGGKIFLENYKTLGLVFFIIAIVGSLIISYPFFLFMVGFQVLYGTYSIRATGWKTNFISSSLVIGLVGVFTFFSGYFLMSPDQSILAVPIKSILFLFIMCGILSNAKDFKDIKGDREHNIQTMPVMFGVRRASTYLGIALYSCIALLAIVFENPLILLFVFPWIVLDFIIKKRVPEYVRFLIIFVEIIIVIFML